MALTAEQPAVVIAEPIDDIEFIMDSESLSLSSSEMSATEVTDTSLVATEEVENLAPKETSASSDVSFNHDDVIAPSAELIPDDTLPEDSADVIVYPAVADVMEITDGGETEGDNNKENTDGKSPLILPAVAIEVGCGGSPAGRDSGLGSSTCSSDSKGSEGTSPSEGQVKEDNNHAVSSNDKTVKAEPKLEDVENNINKLLQKSQTGVASTASVKNELSGQIRDMKRSDLETMIIDKIIEAITIHSHVGSLNQKLIQSNTQKDRLFHKISNLQRQVIELSKAVRSVSENVGRNQSTVNKANQPIRFYRSVGVQVVLEGSPLPGAGRQGTPCQREANPSNKSVLKSGNSKAVPVETPRSVVKQAVTPTQPLSIIGNVNPGLKRNLKPTISVTDVSKQVDQAKIRRVSSSPVNNSVGTSVKTTEVFVNGRSPPTRVATSNVAAAVPMRQPPPLIAHQELRKPAAVSKVLTSISTGKPGVEPGIVDLTDDDVTPVTSTPPKTVTAAAPQATGTIVNGKGNNVVLTNGLQYRLISPTGQPAVQLITQNGQSYQLLTQTPRPVFVAPQNLHNPNSQQVRPVTSSPSQLILRGIIPQSQANNATPISISGGQIMMRPLKSGTTTTVTQIQPKQQVTIAPRVRQQIPQQLVVTNAAPTRTALTNGVATRLSNNQVTRTVVQPVTRVGTRANTEMAKKFVLPPLPPPAVIGNPRRCAKDIPPRPDLSLCEQNDGIVLSWTLKLGSNHAEIQTYQIYACQEPLFNSQKSASWKRVGDVKALPLPMACTLSQFTDENRYHFIVRGVDVYNRTGPFCEASAITLRKKS